MSILRDADDQTTWCADGLEVARTDQITEMKPHVERRHPEPLLLQSRHHHLFVFFATQETEKLLPPLD